MAKRPVEPGIVKLGVRSSDVLRAGLCRPADVRRRLSSWVPSMILRAHRAPTFCSFLAAFVVDGPGIRMLMICQIDRLL